MSDRAFIYCRVSTDEQAKKGYGLDGQERECRERSERWGLSIVRVFKDDCTGTTLDRPAMNQMITALKQGGAQAVIAGRPDRISRDDVDYLVFMRDMQRLGVRIFLATKGEVMRESGAKKIVNYLDGWEGNEDNEKRTGVTTNGRRDKARAGKWVGNGFAPYGYRAEGKREDKRLVIDPEESVVVRRIFAWYTGADGKPPLTFERIEQALTDERTPSPRGGRGWYPATLRAILDRRAYIGEFHYAGIAINLPELAIIDPPTFERVQQQRKLNRDRAARFAKRHYLMTGHFRCACGASMNAYVGGTGYAYYVCSRRRNHKHLSECHQKQIAQRKAEDLVWNWVRATIKDGDALGLGIDRMIERQDVTLNSRRARLDSVSEVMTEIDDSLKALAGDLRKLKGKAGRAVILEQIEDLSERRENLDKERAELDAELAAGTITTEDRATIKRIAEELSEDIDSADWEDKRFVLGRLNVQARHRIDDGGEWLDVRWELMAAGDDAVSLRAS